MNDLNLKCAVFKNINCRSRLRFRDIFDMHVCKNVGDDGLRDRHSCPAYVAPEILIKSSPEYAGRPADVWALGVLLYILLFGR